MKKYMKHGENDNVLMTETDEHDEDDDDSDKDSSSVLTTEKEETPTPGESLSNEISQLSNFFLPLVFESTPGGPDSSE